MDEFIFKTFIILMRIPQFDALYEESAVLVINHLINLSPKKENSINYIPDYIPNKKIFIAA